jgi:hypothetical protein
LVVIHGAEAARVANPRETFPSVPDRLLQSSTTPKYQRQKMKIDKGFGKMVGAVGFEPTTSTV